MARTRLDPYQIEPNGSDGQVLTIVAGEAAWAADPNGLSSARFIWNEVPSGAIDSANVSFTLANTPNASAQVAVYLDGSRLRSGSGNDYTIAASTITMEYAPRTGQNFLADYIRT